MIKFAGMYVTLATYIHACFRTLLVTMATQTSSLYRKRICRTKCPNRLLEGDVTGLTRHRDTETHLHERTNCTRLDTMTYTYIVNRAHKHIAMDTGGHTLAWKYINRFTKTNMPILNSLSLWDEDKPMTEQLREGNKQQLHKVSFKMKRGCMERDTRGKEVMRDSWVEE